MAYILSKLREIVKQYGHDLFVGVCIVLVALISYNLGKTSSVQDTLSQVQPAEISSVKTTAVPVYKTIQPTPSDSRVVASKKSKTKTYYYSWCTNRIKAENQLWFSTELEAQKAGYALAGNCS